MVATTHLEKGSPQRLPRGKRYNDKHASTTDFDARLVRKGNGKEAWLSYQDNAPMENSDGFVGGVSLHHASGTRERDRALARADDHRRRLPKATSKGNPITMLSKKPSVIVGTGIAEMPCCTTREYVPIGLIMGGKPKLVLLRIITKEYFPAGSTPRGVVIVAGGTLQNVVVIVE